LETQIQRIGVGMSRWVAHTNFWTLETGTLIWLIADTTSSYPSTGVDLPILMIDGALVMS
jgi:hypothetical protein